MSDPTLSFNAPKERRLRRLALQEHFLTEDGKPDIAGLSAATGLHRNAVRFILEGKLPGSASPKKPAPKKEDPLS